MSGTTPAITIQVSPALELVTAVSSRSATMKKIENRLVAPEELPADVREWRERVEATLSPFERAGLDVVFSTTTVTILLCYLVIERELHDPSDLIAAIREMTTVEFLDSFREVLQFGQDATDWLTIASVTEAIEKDRAREALPFEEEAARLVSLLSTPDEFRDSLADVLEMFHRRCIADELDRVAAEIAPRVERLRAAIDEDAPGVLDRLSTGNYETLLADRPSIALYPVHFAGDDRAMMLPGAAYIVCGTAVLDSELPIDRGRDGLSERTDELIKALADPNRLAILRLLRQQPRYGKELADHLDVSAATASYHLDKLLAARLARFELSRGRRFYYAINPHGIRELQECLEREFIAPVS
jgi:DNA-binding transcriptional ArsR family regulator